MADINIQRKPPSAIWWILGLVAVLVLLWLLFGWNAEPMAAGFPHPSVPVALSTLALAGA